MTENVKVALLGRNAIIREGLGRILSDRAFRIIHSVNNSAALLHVSDQEDEGVFLILVDTNDCDREAIGGLRSRFPDARIILLADEFDFVTMVDAFRLGVHGYLVKQISCDRLVGALQLVAMGEKVLPSQLADNLPDHVPCYQRNVSTSLTEARLSERELEILRCLIMGCPNKIISRRLDISEATVKVHVKAVLRKLHVSNRTQAAIWAANSGLRAFDLEGQPVDGTPAASIATAYMPAQHATPELVAP